MLSGNLEHVTEAVAALRETLADGFDDARRFLAEAGRQRQRVKPGAVIGIDVIDAGHDDVYQYLIVIRGGGGNFGIAKYFWSAGFCDLNCVHIARLAQKAGRVQDFGRLVALRVKPSRVLLLARLGVRRTFHRR